jgi:E3 ubiquitin-protein ligase HUWE1
MQKNGGYSSIVAIFRIASEVKAAQAISAILKRIDKWLNETTWFWDKKDGVARESTLGAMVNPSTEDIEAQQARFRNLTVLLSHIGLLSDVFINLTYAHGKAATAILTVFTESQHTQILEKIGAVYRACTWENVTIRPTSFWTGDATKTATEQLANSAAAAAPAVDAPTPAAAAAQQKQEQAAEKSAVEVISTPATPDSPNIKLIQDVLQAYTKSCLPLFTSVIKLLVHRRSNDAAHRKVGKEVAKQVAEVVRDTLSWPDAKDMPANLAYAAQSFIIVTKMMFDGSSFYPFFSFATR